MKDEHEKYYYDLLDDLQSDMNRGLCSDGEKKKIAKMREVINCLCEIVKTKIRPLATNNINECPPKNNP